MQSNIANKLIAGILFIGLLLQVAMPVAYAAADYNINTGALTINNSNLSTYDNAKITGSTSSDSEQLTIDGVAVNLIIQDLSITMTGYGGNMSGITLKNGATLNLIVEGTNTLTGAYGGAGIDVPQGCTLNITAGSTATLTARGGDGYGGGAGIGAVGNKWSPNDTATETQSVGTIHILGGTIIATGGTTYAYNNPAFSAAGIGGSCKSTTGVISISGGTITATGGYGSAGIGGGYSGCVESITIQGGTVTATGGYGGSAIGSGFNGNIDYSTGKLSCGTIELTGGVVEAKGNIGYGGFAISGYNVGGTVSIGNGAAVTVKDGVILPAAAGVNTYPLSITIYDGRLTNTIAKSSFTINGSTYQGSIDVTENYVGTLSCTLVVNGTLTGEQNATVSGSGYSWADITCSEGDSGYSAKIGERLYPVYLWFYDPEIISNIGATVSAQRSGTSLNADSTAGIVQLVCDVTIVKESVGAGKMTAWMTAGAETDLFVTTSSLNGGSAMSKSAQTVKASAEGTTVFMHDKEVTEQISGPLNLSYGSITFADNGGKMAITYTPTSGGSATETRGQYYQNEYEIIQSPSGTATTNQIIFQNTSDFVKVKLNGVNMVSQGKAIDLQAAKAQLNLYGSNTIDCGGANNNYMGIHAGEGSELTIDGSGSLEIKQIPETGSGIGGYYHSGTGEGAGTIRIQGGALTISSIPRGPVAGCYGTAIGSSYLYGGDNPGNIYITGGTVNAEMYPYSYNDFGGAAIGGSNNGVCPSITISGGTVKANGEAFASIGRGKNGQGGSLVITGGTIFVNDNGKPIINVPTTNDGTTPVYYTTANVSEIYGTNAAVTDASIAGASYGFNDVKTDANGVLHLYLPASAEGTKSEASFKDAYYTGAITSNESSNVLKKTIQLTAKANSVTTTGAAVNVTTDSGSTVYYVASNTPLATGSEVENAIGVQSVILANPAQDIAISNLNANTTYTYYLTAKNGSTYSDVVPVTFTTAEPPAPTVTGVTVAPATVSIEKGTTQQFTASVNGTNNPAQTVTWTMSGGKEGTSISAGGLLTVAADEIATELTVTATTVDTSKAGTATVTVTATATGGSSSDPKGITIEAVFTGGTYNGQPYAYTDTPTFKNGTDTVAGITYTTKYAGRDGTAYAESETAPTNAGKYNLILTVSGESANTYAGTTAIGFEITKKQITAKPKDASIESNASFPAYTWSVETGIEGETITASNAESVVMEAQENGAKVDAVKLGTFDIVFTIAPVFNQNGEPQKNYAIQIGKGKLTVTAHNSGSGSSTNNQNNSSTTVTTPPATSDNPNPPTQATTTIPSAVTGGTANVTVSPSAVTDAISKAQAEAKKTGTEENGIVLEIKGDTQNSTASSLSANLPRETVDALVNAEVSEFRLNSGVAEINLNLETLKTIQNEIGADVNISATKVDNSTLSAEAKVVVGNRPVFDLSITGTNGTRVTDFGKGKISVSIPYTLGAGEKAENVAVYYIDSTGKVQEIPNSVYDEKTKTLMFVTDHFSKYAIGYKADETSLKTATFTDIANHWAKEDIEFVTAKGIFSGTGNGKFSPDMSMTRGMFVTALGRLAKADAGDCKTTKFTDVKAGSYYLPYIEWASQNGIVNGTSEAAFAPDQSVTREQMAVIMANYAKTIGFKLPKLHIENTFADDAEIAGFAQTAVQEMQTAGILAGKNSNIFDPQGTAARAEVSAVFKRFVELVEKH